MIKITVIAENTAARANVLGEHGLSFWIETPAGRVLFDAGAAFSFRHNVGALGIPLERADAIALSHGHSDHTGGLAWALAAAPAARIFLHPPRCCGSATTAAARRAIGIPVMRRLQNCGRRLEQTAQPPRSPGVRVTGFVPRKSGGRYRRTVFLDTAGVQPDPIERPSWLRIRRTAWSWCAMPGDQYPGTYQGLAGDRPLGRLLGGLHLGAALAGAPGVDIAELRKWQPRQLLPMHCGLYGVGTSMVRLPGCCAAAECPGSNV